MLQENGSFLTTRILPVFWIGAGYNDLDVLVRGRFIYRFVGTSVDYSGCVRRVHRVSDDRHHCLHYLIPFQRIDPFRVTSGTKGSLTRTPNRRLQSSKSNHVIKVCDFST